jgi:hypothetical protein
MNICVRGPCQSPGCDLGKRQSPGVILFLWIGPEKRLFQVEHPLTYENFRVICTKLFFAGWLLLYKLPILDCPMFCGVSSSLDN